ncbi:MAG: aminotransferase class I/II-fold pyridoxal phosphate-dependent enzyme [Gammaproteobacteria bacterium]|nr:aminotransferase class I/II-fold pyridoxal phosphate-dependent enzyme [Gammaproteobacteria bacterium]
MSTGHATVKLPIPLANRLQALAGARNTAALVRVRRPRGAAQRALAARNFASNDYLGLSTDRRLRAATVRAAAAYGAGSGASALVCGYTDLHAALELELADFTGRSRALVFPSGYHANLAVLGALARRRDAVFADRLVHASLIDAIVLSRARLRRYAHRDPAALAAQLGASRAALKFVVSDGVFSMDGDIAPVRDLARVARRHDAVLFIDDAHGLGVIGPGGRGAVDLHACGEAEVPLLVGTFGKAFGAAGAFAAGPADLMEAVLQHGRTYAYTTALAPAATAAARAALAIIREEPWRRAHLAGLIDHFRAAAAAAGIGVLPSSTPIQPVPVGDARRALRLGDALCERGFNVPVIRPPTVPAGTARLRISLTARHCATDVDALVETLDELLRREGASP